LFSPCLSKDTPERLRSQLIAGFPGDRDETAADRMSELSVASALADDVPAVPFQQAKDVADFQLTPPTVSTASRFSSTPRGRRAGAIDSGCETETPRICSDRPLELIG